MKHVCIIFPLWTVAFLLLTSCQRSSAVPDDDSETLTDSVSVDSNETDESSESVDTETVIETETASVMDSETLSAVETGSEDSATISDSETVDTETVSDAETGTEDTESQGDSETSDPILGSWIVTSLTVDGEDRPITSEYLGGWEADGEIHLGNVISFQERSDWDCLYAKGLCNNFPYDGGANIDNLEDIEFISIMWVPIMGSITPPECPDECSQWKDDYMTALNSATTYEIIDDELALFNDDKTNVIHFDRCSCPYD